MAARLTIRIVDPDDDYLGVEIHAFNDRFAGSTRIYAGIEELSEFAAHIAGFPAKASDERIYEFGSRKPSVAGGYCSLRFHCLDRSGHAAVEIALEDDDQLYTVGAAQLSFHIAAAAIDRFARALRELQGARSGEATLSSTD